MSIVPIIGGVVGGVAFVLLAAILLWYFLRKRLIRKRLLGASTIVPEPAGASPSPGAEKTYSLAGSPSAASAWNPYE